MIRKGTFKDMQQLIELGYRLCDRTPLAHVSRDRPSISRTLSECMTSQFGCCFVAEHDGKITGAIVGFSQPLWFSTKRQVADLMFVAETPGDGPALLREFIDWGWSVPGVVEVATAQSSGIDVDRTAVLYERMGFVRSGGVFSMTKRPTKAQRAVA